MESPDVAYHAAQWSTFFSAETSASAALLGLLFVSISINLQQIVKVPLLTARAGKALATLGAVLLISIFCLVPGQSSRTLGAQIIVSAVAVWIAATVLQRKASYKNPYVSGVRRGLPMALTQAASFCLATAAVSLMLGRGRGLFWLVPGTLISFFSALLDAWVLLIEIQR